MTPTLFDVYEILGLSVDDEPVTCRPITDLRKFIEANLGIVPTEGNLTTIKHSWLKANFRELQPDASFLQIVRHTRAYLLFLISVTIFANASVATVPTRYLQFFEDIEQVIWNPYFKLDETISNDRHEAFQTVMAFQEIIYLVVRGPVDMVGSEIGEMSILTRFIIGLSRHNHMMIDIKVDTASGLPSEEYKAWYSRASHPIIHNVSAVQASTIMLTEALTLRQKWYPEVCNRVNNVFKMLSKFVPVDMEDIEARMELLQSAVNEEAVQEEGRQDVVGESSRAVDDLAPSTQPAVEERRSHNTRQKQYQPKRRRHP
ncbi:hypothetical protein AMTR_s00077p00064360 [Amborella trichopoda]|uniref:Aminotransferase-like plant mobile domain-containing protein n=1 Tax=Amborella trichopoda TaxID=13333 RepID=W1P8Y4_AMBTC|nr:hypothetical protein AMTR_s00077p00064360 [Amborella trichopoda]